MKKAILLMIVVFSFASCKKLTGPFPARQQAPADISADADTIPDNAAFRLKLVKDSANSDETLFIFRHTATTAYSPADAAYLQGFGKISLASISSDGRYLAINCRPYIPGMPIGLNVHTSTEGMFRINTSYEKQIPSYIQIWLVDMYLKDSIDVRRGSYNFTVSKADTGSFGDKRFKLILKKGGQQQTATPD